MFAAERQFVTTAQNHLGQLMGCGGDVSVVSQGAALHEIKHAAVNLKARAIYRAAILCEDILNCSGPDKAGRFQAALARLKSLLGLYENGLREIDPEFKNPKSEHTIAPALATSIQPPKAANENAAKLLTPLLGLVRGGDPKQAIKFLTQYGHNNALKVNASTKLTNHQTNKPNNFSHTMGVMRFETMMGQITNRVLSEARLNSVGVSLSYASGFDNIDISIVKPLQAVLENMCLEIVRYGLVDETLTHKYARRVWQISVTGSVTKKGLGQKHLISVSWPGHALSRHALPEHEDQTHTMSEFQNIGGHINHKTTKHADRDVVHGVDTGLDIQVLEILCPIKRPKKHQTKAAPDETNNQKEQVKLYPPAVNM